MDSFDIIQIVIDEASEISEYDVKVNSKLKDDLAMDSLDRLDLEIAIVKRIGKKLQAHNSFSDEEYQNATILEIARHVNELIEK